MRRVLLFLFAFVFFGSGLSIPEVRADIVQDSDFIYVESETEIRIHGYSGTSTDVTIPGSINGKPVTFVTGLNDKQLTSVTIPDSVTVIGNGAFTNNALTDITIPGSVTHIDYYAFRNNQLTGVEIPDSVEFIGRAAFQSNRLQRATLGNVSEIGAYAFSDNQLEEIAIPADVAEIGENAFEKNNLRSIAFQGPTTRILARAFADNQLTAVALPATLKYIGTGAFNLNRIRSIAIPPNIEFGGDVFNGNRETAVRMYFAKWGSTPHLNYANQYDVLTWPCEYRIRYDGNGSAGGTPPADTSYVCYRNQGAVPDQGSLSKPGYAFKGWNTEPDGTGTNYAGGSYPILYGIAADTFTLYADWERESYPVAFDTGGDTGISDQTVAHGELASEPPAPSRTNYVFEGWYTDSGYTRSWDFGNDTVVEPMTLYAKWKWSGEAAIASVRFTSGGLTAAAGDTVSVSGVVADVYGSSVPNAFVKLESSLGTWNDSNGGKLSVATGEDGTFHAAWTAPFVEEPASVTLTAIVDGADIAPGSQTIQVVPSERDDTWLIGLSLNGGTLSPAFSAETSDYAAADVGHGVTSVTVTAVAANDRASITINGIPAASGSSVDVPLQPGANLIPIVVAAEDRIPNRTYTISVSRAYDATSGDYVYSLTDVSGGSGVTIRGYNGADTNVVIPETLDGHAVMGIGTGAFMNKQLTAVSIPDTVTSIGEYAFSDNALTEISLPEGLTAVHRGAFMNNRLASVVFPKTMTGIDGQAFYNNELTRIILPANVTLGNEAFGGARNGGMMIFPPDTQLLMYAINNAHPYTESHYRVLYDGNGQTEGKAPEDPVQYHYYSSTPIQTEGALKRNGHSFAGWNAEPDGSGQSYAAGESYEFKRIDGDLTLYAMWERKPIVGVERISVAAEHDADSVAVGGTLGMIASVLPDDATIKQVAWTVEAGTGEAAISAAGVLTGMKAGTVTVVATAIDGSGVAGSQAVTIYGQSGSGGGGDPSEAPQPQETPPVSAPEPTPTGSKPSASTPEPTPTRPTAQLPVIEVGPGQPAIDVNDPKYVEIMKEAISEKHRASRNAKIPEFSDTGNHWAVDSIRLFARLGIVRGYSDGTFQPDKRMTRGEFAMMVTKLFSFARGSQAAASFNDLEGSWAKDAVLTLAGNGAIFGYEDGSFRADRFMTRAEMVAVMARIVNLNEVKRAGTAAFRDIDHSWGRADIQRAAEAGIIRGLDANTFAPEKYATRAEALTLLLHTLKLSPEIDDWLASLEQELHAR